VALSNKELVAFADPRGIRPLVIGKNGKETVIASETCGLRTVGAKFFREVLPGELMTVSKNGLKSVILAKQDPEI